MKILDLSIFRGRNIYSHHTVIRMVVDIDIYGNIPTKDIPGFNEALLSAFPGLITNHCGLGYEGGFLEKLNTGTYLAHVLEHVILEMQYMLGYDVRYGKTRVMEEPSRYYLVYEYTNEVCGMECGKAAVFILNRFINGEAMAVDAILGYLKKISLDAELGPSTASIVSEAKLRGIPVTQIGNESLLSLGYGKYRRTLESTLTDATSCISADIASNKHLTKTILSDNGIPVPHGKVVYTEISALMTARDVGLPVVVKPYDGNQGKGVHLNITEEEDIKAAFQDAIQYSKGVLVEKYVKGKDYRVLVVGREVKAVAERLSASVLGDGIHTVTELIDIINQDENRGENHEKPLTKIRLDAVSHAILKKKGLTVDSVPGDGETITLRENGNLSTGGVAIDYTDNIHPENADIAVLAASAIGIDIAGIDFVTEDISQPIRETGGVVVEVNAAPGIRMHLYPSAGTPRNVARDIVDLLYPPNEIIDFPIVAITGTNGKTTTTRLISHVLGTAGRTVGMTTTSGVYINGKCISKGDNTGPVSARAVLSNKAVDAAVLETARGGILRSGLGYDLADVGVITNITEDHLGLDGINTLEEMAFVKSLVVEAVKENGYAVLNADDVMTPMVLERVKVKPILFTWDLEKAKIRFGENPVYVHIDQGILCIYDGFQVLPVIKVEDIPVTAKGAISCNVENCMAAAATLWGLHVPIRTIAAGLTSFTENPGRFNFYAIHGFTVMVDYAHNKACYQAVMQAVSEDPHPRRIGVIGMPGDREDNAIREVGALCGGFFQKVYVKEDHDLRGREQGAVAALMEQGLLQGGCIKENIIRMDDELEALKAAISQADQGDLIMVFYEELETIAAYLKTLQQ